MRVKKTSRKNILSHEGKENMSGTNGTEEGRVPVCDSMTAALQSTSSPSSCTIIENEEENEILADLEALEKENEILADLEALEKENQSTADAAGDSKTLIDVMEKDGGADASKVELQYIFTTDGQCTGPPKSRGEKRPFDHIENVIEDEKSSGSKNTLDTYAARSRKKCKQLVARVKELESDWMPRPQHPQVVKYFVEAADLLRNVENDIDESKDQYMFELMESLGLEKDDVLQCKKRTSTATARQIIKLKYPTPEPDFGFDNVDQTTIDTIIQLTRCLNPSEASSKAKIRKAIGNYFACIKYAKKIRSMIR